MYPLCIPELAGAVPGAHRRAHCLHIQEHPVASPKPRVFRASALPSKSSPCRRPPTAVDTLQLSPHLSSKDTGRQAHRPRTAPQPANRTGSLPSTRPSPPDETLAEGANTGGEREQAETDRDERPSESRGEHRERHAGVLSPDVDEESPREGRTAAPTSTGKAVRPSTAPAHGDEKIAMRRSEPDGQDLPSVVFEPGFSRLKTQRVILDRYVHGMKQVASVGQTAAGR